MVNLPLLDAPPVDDEPDEAAMARYRAEGTERALALDNRNPVRQPLADEAERYRCNDDARAAIKDDNLFDLGS